MEVSLNGRVAKLLRKLSAETHEPYKECKKLWESWPVEDRDYKKLELVVRAIKLKRWDLVDEISEAAFARFKK